MTTGCSGLKPYALANTKNQNIMNATFYFKNEQQAERFSRSLRECFILSIISGKMVEIYNFSMIKEECKKDVLGIAKRIYKEVVTDMGAVDKFANMTMQECIDMWNEYATDQFNQLVAIHPMEDEPDWCYQWNSEQEDTYGYYDIYVLMQRNEDWNGNTMYVTEIGYYFE